MQVSRLALVPCDLRTPPASPGGLGASLRGAGFDPSITTLWTAEGLLYYLAGGAGVVGWGGWLGLEGRATAECSMLWLRG